MSGVEVPRDEASVTERDGCPVEHCELSGPDAPPLSMYRDFDRLRQLGSAVRISDGGGAVLVTRYEEVLSAAQDAKTFSKVAIDRITNKPGGYKLSLNNMDGSEHLAWRRVLAKYFTPGRAAELEPELRSRVHELIDSFVDDGHCDFIGQFAQQYPTYIFLNLFGLSPAELPRFLEWEHRAITPVADDVETAQKISRDAQTEIIEFFRAVLDERRRIPVADRGSDLISESLSWRIDSAPIPDEELLLFYLLMFEAGLHTVTAELGYSFYHFATHPADRERVVREPEIVGNAVEELLRVYPVVTTPRYTLTDTTIGGLSVSAGERVMLCPPAAGRDEGYYPHSADVDLSRGKVPHLTFGAGPHRCLGANLARHELNVAIEEWHKRIPEYTLAADPAPRENRAFLIGLRSLGLQWA